MVPVSFRFPLLIFLFFFLFSLNFLLLENFIPGEEQARKSILGAFQQQNNPQNNIEDEKITGDGKGLKKENPLEALRAKKFPAAAQQEIQKSKKNENDELFSFSCFSSADAVLPIAFSPSSLPSSFPLLFPPPPALAPAMPATALLPSEEDFKASRLDLSIDADLFAPWQVPELIKQVNELFSKQWKKVDSSPQQVEILVFGNEIGDTAVKAADGNTMGELLYWRSIITSVMYLPHFAAANKASALHKAAFRLFVATSPASLLSFTTLDRLEAQWKLNRLVILLSGYSLGPLVDFFRSQGREELFQRLRSCFLILDDWGTPPHQDWYKVHLAQYLVPWNYEKNQNFIVGNFLSEKSKAFQQFQRNSLFPITKAIEKIASGEEGGKNLLQSNKFSQVLSNSLLISHPLGQKSLQILVWGKEAKYFRLPGVFTLLDNIQNRLNLTVLVTAKPSVNQELPANVKNLGLTDENRREELLASSLIIIGLGDPVLGATPFQAMKYGTIYLNPKFRERKVFGMNSEQHYSSQHPFVEQLPETISQGIFLDRTEEILGKIQFYAENYRFYQELRARVAAGEEISSDSPAAGWLWQFHLPYFPLELTFAAFCKRLLVASQWVLENAREKATAAGG